MPISSRGEAPKSSDGNENRISNKSKFLQQGVDLLSQRTRKLIRTLSLPTYLFLKRILFKWVLVVVPESKTSEK
jgi:hypothetical protein